MLKTVLKNNNPRGENNLEVPVLDFHFPKKEPPQPKQPHKDWILISGIATSQVRTKNTTDTPAYIFFRLNDKKHSQAECVSISCKSCEIPVIFRIKQEGKYFKPPINKGDNLELGGYFADSDKPRPSFTAYTYQIMNSSNE